MGFRELLNRAKTMDDTAMVQIIELYNPLLYKYANVNSQFDQDLYEEFVYRLIICVVKFPYYTNKYNNAIYCIIQLTK